MAFSRASLLFGLAFFVVLLTSSDVSAHDTAQTGNADDASYGDGLGGRWSGHGSSGHPSMTVRGSTGSDISGEGRTGSDMTGRGRPGHDMPSRGGRGYGGAKTEN